MATKIETFRPIIHTAHQTTADEPHTYSALRSAVALLQPAESAPFAAIRSLFDHLGANPTDATKLNATYPVRGVFKTAASHDPACDQKLTIDLSPSRTARIPHDLHASLAAHGLDEILSFFTTIADAHVQQILAALSAISGVDMASLHREENLNFRLCDYTPATAAPLSTNGCGAHIDYGTFSIIFQDGQAGLEAEAPGAPGVWVPIPGDATVVLCGWCAVILSGARVKAVRHRVRRMQGVRRLSAVLFVAPDLDVKLKPAVGSVEGFSDAVMEGSFDVGWFKEVMGKRWRYREGNEVLREGEETDVAQDKDIERLVWK